MPRHTARPAAASKPALRRPGVAAPSRRATCRGISLIEACAVLAVLSVLAGLALPSFGDHLAKRRLEGRAVELSNDLQYLRSEAVSRNEAMRISFGTDAGGSCYVLHPAEAKDEVIVVAHQRVGAQFDREHLGEACEALGNEGFAVVEAATGNRVLAAQVCATHTTTDAVVVRGVRRGHQA